MAKFRTSFVTNSSSSSFLIALKVFPELDAKTLTKYPFLKTQNELIKTALMCDTEYSRAGEICETFEECAKGFVELYGWSDDTTLEEILEESTYLQSIFEECKCLLESGYHILCKKTDHNDSYFFEMVYALAKNNENIVIVSDE